MTKSPNPPPAKISPRTTNLFQMQDYLPCFVVDLMMTIPVVAEPGARSFLELVGDVKFDLKYEGIQVRK